MTNVIQMAKDNIGAIAAGIGGIAVGATVATIAAKRSASKKSRKRRVSKNRATRKRAHRNKMQRQPYTAGKRKDTSHRRIRYTSNNQPYIILRSGKARFISKRSVSSSRKRKGGKY